MEWDLSRQSSIVEIWTVEKQPLFHLLYKCLQSHGVPGSPSAAPSNAGLARVFGHRLSEFRNKPRSLWLVRASFDGRPPSRVAQETSGSWGALSFGYFIFGQAKKRNSPKGETVRNKQPTHMDIHSHLTTER
jgi:hypothetical protein